MKKYNIQQGFTLIEIVITVAIIGIVAAIALPAYSNYVKRAYVIDGLSLATNIKFASYNHFYFEAEWPLNNADAALLPPTSYQSQAVKSISIDNGSIVITYNKRVIDGATIILSPSVDEGTISWDCSTGTIPKIIRPANCKL